MSRQRPKKNHYYPILVGTVRPNVILAAVLLTVMAMLWLRVFLGGGSNPAAAEAQTDSAAATGSSSAEPAAKSISLQPALLPVVPGRHDRLHRDPFILDRSQWGRSAAEAGLRNSGSTSPDAAEQKHRSNLQKISQRLKLEAVVKDSGGIPVKACVDGIVLFKGSTMKVKENGEIYDLNVTEISATEVQLEWQVFALTIKMPSSEWQK